MAVDKRNNYDVEQECNNKNLNSYKKFLELAKIKVRYIRRIENIIEYLVSDQQNSVLKPL